MVIFIALLRIAVTRAVFQAWGVCQWCMIAGRCAVLWRISLAVSFSIFVGILSGPGTLLEFRASSCFIMPFSPIARV